MEPLAALFGRIDAGLTRLGVTAGVFTVARIVLAVMLAGVLAAGHMIAALFVLIVALAAEAVARAGVSPWSRLEPVIGMLAQGAVPFGFVLNDPARAVAALFLVLGLCLARLAGVANMLGDGAARIVTALGLAIACLFPEHFAPVAYLVGLFGFVLAGLRAAAGLGPAI